MQDDSIPEGTSSASLTDNYFKCSHLVLFLILLACRHTALIDLPLHSDKATRREEVFNFHRKNNYSHIHVSSIHKVLQKNTVQGKLRVPDVSIVTMMCFSSQSHNTK